MQSKKRKNDKESINYNFKRRICELSNKLFAANEHRQQVRSKSAKAIASKQLNEQERKILEANDNNKFKRKRDKVDCEEANKSISKGTNTLAEGDNFNFVYTGHYGTKHIIAGKVQSFINQKADSTNKQKLLCSPSYPAVVNIVFQQEESKLDPVFRKKGQHSLLKEGLEKLVNFH